MGKRHSVVALAVAFALACTGLAGCANASGGDGGSTSPAGFFQQGVPAFNFDGSIEETTMLDNEVISVVAKGLTYENDNACLSIAITNKTSAAISVSACTLGYSANYVNDCMIDAGYFSCDIAAGETVEEEAKFGVRELKMNGIQGIGEIGLGFRVTNDEYDELFEGVAGVDTSLAGTEGISSGSFLDALSNTAFQSELGFSVTPTATDVAPYAQLGVGVQAAALVVNKDGDTMLMVEFKNETEGNVEVMVKDVSIDGAMAYEGLWSIDMAAPQKRVVVGIRFNSMIEDDQLENFDLSNIGEVGMSLSLRDANHNTLVESFEVVFGF